MKKTEKVKVAFNFPRELWDKVSLKAEQLSIDRTAYVKMAISQKLQADEMIDSIPRLFVLADELKKDNKK